MSNWNEVVDQFLEKYGQKSNSEFPTDELKKNSAALEIRNEKLKHFSDLRGRNVIAYYSGWLQHQGSDLSFHTQINDDDKNGFMACFYQMDFNRGLDLILHSPGGDVAATETILNYIRSKFGKNIEVFVPQLSMSGGTMMSFLGEKIWMGLHSNLGPIDPQFGSIPAKTILKEFDRIKEELKNDPDLQYAYYPILSQIRPSFLTQCHHAITWSEDIAKEALEAGMFSDLADGERERKALQIANYFSSDEENLSHSRHIHRDKCKDSGLAICNFEDDQKLQDLILAVHHSFMVSFNMTGSVKLIQNQDGIVFGKYI